MPDTELGTHGSQYVFIPTADTSPLHQSALAKSCCNNKTTTSNHGWNTKISFQLVLHSPALFYVILLTSGSRIASKGSMSCSSATNLCPIIWPHGLQHARLPCPSLSPRVCSNSCPLSWWCHATISSSVVPVSSCLQSFPASGSFPMSWLFASGGQSIVCPVHSIYVTATLTGLRDLSSWEKWQQE